MNVLLVYSDQGLVLNWRSLFQVGLPGSSRNRLQGRRRLLTVEPFPLLLWQVCGLCSAALRPRLRRGCKVA